MRLFFFSFLHTDIFKYIFKRLEIFKEDPKVKMKSKSQNEMALIWGCLCSNEMACLTLFLISLKLKSCYQKQGWTKPIELHWPVRFRYTVCLRPVQFGGSYKKIEKTSSFCDLAEFSAKPDRIELVLYKFSAEPQFIKAFLQRCHLDY